MTRIDRLGTRRTGRWTIMFAAMALATVGVIPGAEAIEGVTVTDLGTLGGVSSFATDLNELGQVVGNSHTSSGAPRGFYWSSETGMIDIGTLGGDHSVGSAINDLGQVVGRSRVAEGSPRTEAFVWTVEDGMQTLTHLGGIDSYAFDVNNLGQVTGYIYHHYDSGGDSPAFVWSPPDQLTLIPTLGGNLAQRPNVINELGQVVGAGHTATGEWHAFFWSEATGTVPIIPSGSTYSELIDVNERGQAAGRHVTANGYRAFFWTLDGGIVDVPTLPNSAHCNAFAINNLGQIAGTCDGRAFVWSQESGIVDIGELPDEYYHTVAFDINDFGQAVGQSGGPGQRAFLWTAADGITDIGPPDTNGYVRQINNSGHAMGALTVGGTGHAGFWTVPLPPRTPIEQIEDIATEVNDLVSSSDMNAGEGEALLAKLRGAAALLEAERTTAACNMLDAFINQINAKVDSGQLSPADGQAIVDLTDAVTACQ